MNCLAHVEAPLDLSRHAASAGGACRSINANGGVRIENGEETSRSPARAALRNASTTSQLTASKYMYYA